MFVFALIASLLALCSVGGFQVTAPLALWSAHLGTNSLPKNRFSGQLQQLQKSRLRMTDLLRGSITNDQYYQLTAALREERAERNADNAKIRDRIYTLRREVENVSSISVWGFSIAMWALHWGNPPLAAMIMGLLYVFLMNWVCRSMYPRSRDDVR